MKLVIKLGGELLTAPQEAQTRSIIEDVCALQNEGYEIIFVHGGGPQTTALQKALGQKPNIVGGRRITDQETLQAIKMAVGGDANLELCRQILARGLVPVGLNGASGAMIRAIRRPPRVVSGCGEEPIDFGLVGDVTGVNADVLNLLTTQQFVPVWSSGLLEQYHSEHSAAWIPTHTSESGLLWIVRRCSASFAVLVAYLHYLLDRL